MRIKVMRIYLTWPKVKLVCTVQVYWDFEINMSTYLLLLFLMYKKPLCYFATT